MEIKLLQITPDCEKLIEKIGRLCWKSEDKTTEDSFYPFIQNLIRKNHESVLEHAVVTFKIEGISRACSHQLVRHRIASYTQKSQRYVDESNFKYIIPEKIKESGIATRIFEEAMELNKVQYKVLRDLEFRSEDARSILPNAIATEIVMTMNFRSLRHFLKERLSSGAQSEIKKLAAIILNIMIEKAKTCFEDLQFYGK